MESAERCRSTRSASKILDPSGSGPLAYIVAGVVVDFLLGRGTVMRRTMPLDRLAGAVRGGSRKRERNNRQDAGASPSRLRFSVGNDDGFGRPRHTLPIGIFAEVLEGSPTVGWLTRGEETGVGIAVNEHREALVPLVHRLAREI